MTLDVKRLRELSEKATPGPYVHPDDIDGFGPICEFEGMRIVAVCAPGEKKEFSNEQIHANQCFFAAANPKAIIALLDRLEAAETALRFYATKQVWSWNPESLNFSAITGDLQDARFGGEPVRVGGAKARSYFDQFGEKKP